MTNAHMWERNIVFDVKVGIYRPTDRVGFTNYATYVLRDDSLPGFLYLFDMDRYRVLPKVHVKDLTCEEAKEIDLLEMFPLVDNLVLLNEENLDPFVDIVQVRQPSKDQARRIKKENLRDTKGNEVSRSSPSSDLKLLKLFKCFNKE